VKVVEVEFEQIVEPRWSLPMAQMRPQQTSQHRGPHVQDTDIYCGFFQTEFHYSNRKQYSEKYGSNCTNNYMPRFPQYLFHSGFLT